MAADDVQGYVIPTLSYDEIVNIIQQDGLFGDEAKTLTMEHLKCPTPVFVAQICTFILQKLEVNIDNISQPQLQSSMCVKYPNTLNHMYRYNHLALQMEKALPDYNLRKFSIEDIMNPTWRRLQKILSAFVNYYRSNESTVKYFQDIVTVHEDGFREKEKLENEIERKRDKIAELRTDRSENKQMLERLQKEIDEIDHFLEVENGVIKKQKNVNKEKIKSVLEERANKLDKIQSEVDSLQKEKARLMSLVVGSPKRFMKEQDQLKERVQSVEEVCFGLQDKARKAQKMLHDANAQHKLLMDMIKMGEVAIDRNKRRSDHEVEIQTMQNEFISLEIANEGILQDISSYKQQIISAEQKISRCGLRWKTKAETLKSILNQVTREHDIQEAQGHEISNELSKIKTEVDKLKEEEKLVKDEHNKIMEMLEAKEQQIMLSLDKYHAHMMGQIAEWNSEERCL